MTQTLLPAIISPASRFCRKLPSLLFSNTGKMLSFLMLFVFTFQNAAAQFAEQWVTQPLKSGAELKEEFCAQAIDTEKNLVSATSNGVFRQNTRIALFKHNQNGQKLWTRIYNDGTSTWDTPTAIKLDKAGNIYLLGWSQLNNEDDTGTAFMAKYSAAGEKVWAQPLSSNHIYPYEFTVSENGEVYVIADVPEGTGMAPRIKKLDTTGKTVWSADFIGTDGKGGSPSAVALDGKGSLYVGGTLSERVEGSMPVYFARLVKYSTQSGSKTFTGQYDSGIPNQTDYETMQQVLVAPSGSVYLVTQQSGLYIYQVLLYKITEAGELSWAKAVGNTEESTHIKAVLSADEQVTLLCKELRYRAVWDYFLTAYNSAGQRQYYHTYNEYIPQTSNIRRVVPKDIGLSPDGSIALTGFRDYIQSPPAWYMPPTVLEPARETIILYGTTGEENWKETSDNSAGARTEGYALDFISGGSFYIAGRQVSNEQLVAARYTNCSGFIVSAGQDKTICQGNEVRLEASAAVSYAWSPAAGLSSTSVANPVASPAQTTTYTVTATNAEGCTATAQVTVTVNPLPAASISTTTATTFCQGGSITLQANTGSGITGYQWLRNGEEITGATAATFVASSSGSYSLRTFSGNCTSTSSITEVTVTTAITNNLIFRDQSICTGTAPPMIAGETPHGGTGTYTYQWQRSTNGSDFSNISGATTKNYEPGTLQTTTWFRRNVVSGSCTSTSPAVKITVNPLPVVSLGAFEQTCQTTAAFTLTGGSPAGGTYSGKGVVGGKFYPAEAGTGTHTITYIYTSATGCQSSATQSIVVASCSVTGIEDNELDLPVSIYPNPTSGKVYIEMDMPTRSAVELRVTDVSGRVLYTRLYENPQNKLTETLQLENYPRGLYLLQVTTTEGVLQRKIVLR